MRIPPALMIVAPLVALAACAATPAETARMQQQEAAQQDELAGALRGLHPAESRLCVSEFDLRGAQLHAYGSTLLYTVTNRRKYRSDTSGGCDRVGRDDILVTRSTIGSLCRGDIAHTVDRTSGFNSGSCTFGAFVTYR